MNSYNGINLPIVCTVLFCLLAVDFANSLRDVRVKIPHAVRRGEKAVLKCLYDLEGDTLYSVKWYKGRREFYSFTPKDSPAMKVFQFAGVKVDRIASNESQLVLDAVNLATTGKYSCEVSADAPSFHTLISAGELEVVEVPGKDPVITGIHPRYRVGDIVRGNCTSRHSKPAANLTWTINGHETNPAHIRHHKPLKDPREMETAISGIHFVITPQHFQYGKIKLRCTAYIHDVYWKSTEKSIEEERHRHNTNTVNNFGDEYFDTDDGNQIDRSDMYMTHIKGDVSSLNANSAAISQPSYALQWAMLAISLLYAMQQLLQSLCRQQQQEQQQPVAITPASRKKRQQLSGTSGAISKIKTPRREEAIVASVLSKHNTQCQTKQTNAYANFILKSIKAQQQQEQQRQQHEKPLEAQSHLKTMATKEVAINASNATVTTITKALMLTTKTAKVTTTTTNTSRIEGVRATATRT